MSKAFELIKLEIWSVDGDEAMDDGWPSGVDGIIESKRERETAVFIPCALERHETIMEELERLCFEALQEALKKAKDQFKGTDS